MTASAKMSSGLPPSTIIPQGVGAPPPPGLDPKRGKLMCIKVRMLDDTVGVFHLGHKAVGQALFDEVCRHLNLLECDYFGLEFRDSMGNQVWLDKEKPILRQITNCGSDARFSFCIKFYTPNPADLEEEYTRYLFALQMKRDLSRGEFVCNETTGALMAAYIVQSECGDYSPEDYPDHTYLNSARFIPHQTPEFQAKVMENHKKLVGMSPAESDLAFLETSRRCDFYGVKFHHAKDIEGTEVNVAVQHLGVRVFHQLQCASTFSWAKIRKLSFKRKKFLIKLHPESYQYYKDTIEFIFETRNESKAFWKKCVEHHAFFRCTESAQISKQQAKLFSKGSSFKYQGRTQKQLIDYVREHHKRREPFTRPIHSSYVRSPRSLIGSNYASDRSLPTPLVPAGVSGPCVTPRPVNGDVGNRALTEEVCEAPDAPQVQRRVVGTMKGVSLSCSREQTAPAVLSATIPSPMGTHVVSFHVPISVSHGSVSASCSGYALSTGSVSPPAARKHPNAMSECSRPLDKPRSMLMSRSLVLPTQPILTYSEEQANHLVVNQHGGSTDRYVNGHSNGMKLSSSVPLNGDITVSLPLSCSKDGGLDLDNLSQDSYQLSDHEEPMDRERSRRSQSPCKGTAPFPIEMEEDLPPPPPPDTYGCYSTVKPTNIAIAVPTPTVPHSISPSQPPCVAPKPIIKTAPIRPTTLEGSPKTYGATGPMPGKVLTKQTAVIIAQPQVTQPVTQPMPQTQAKREKPVPPPKPKIVTPCAVGAPLNATPPAAFVPPARLVAVERERGAVPEVNVESVDNPDVQHKFIMNSNIPYVLHMRHVTAEQQNDEQGTSNSHTVSHSTKENQDPCTSSAFDRSRSGGYKSATIEMVRLRKKSIELVPKRSLPSPGAFSSQDHSVSPTTPDSNVLDYVERRRRSLSQEMNRKNNKRTDPRRLTQPISGPLSTGCDPTAVSSFIGNSSPTPSNRHSTIGRKLKMDLDDMRDSGDDMSVDGESRSLHEEMDALDAMGPNSSRLSDASSMDGSVHVPPPPPPLVSVPVSGAFEGYGFNGSPPFIDGSSTSNSSANESPGPLPHVPSDHETTPQASQITILIPQYHQTTDY